MIARVRTSVVVIHNGKILSFLAVDPTSGREYHFLPGGEIEGDETAPDAAVRETLEETGFQVIVDPETAIDAEYPFHWNGEDYHSFTIFYRASLRHPFQAPARVDDAAYNKGVVWASVNEIPKYFGYAPEVLSAVSALARA